VIVIPPPLAETENLLVPRETTVGGKEMPPPSPVAGETVITPDVDIPTETPAFWLATGDTTAAKAVALNIAAAATLRALIFLKFDSEEMYSLTAYLHQ
jgi:hypothetical protein